MNILLIPLFAIFNRLRGADGFTVIGKTGTMGLLFWLLWPAWWQGLTVAALYLIGQSCGWGWWIGAILTREPNTRPIEGTRERAAHWIACSLVKDSLWQSRIALTIIGFFWWFTVLLSMLLFGSCGWLAMIAATLICSAGFPLAFEIARTIPPFKIKLVDHDWEVGEVIYGAIQGAAVCLLII